MGACVLLQPPAFAGRGTAPGYTLHLDNACRLLWLSCYIQGLLVPFRDPERLIALVQSLCGWSSLRQPGVFFGSMPLFCFVSPTIRRACGTCVRCVQSPCLLIEGTCMPQQQ